MRARQGSGAPTFCWHCNKQLQRAPGKGLGLFYFELVRDPKDPMETEHRVHSTDCLQAAKHEGLVHVKQPK